MPYIVIIDSFAKFGGQRLEFIWERMYNFGKCRKLSEHRIYREQYIILNAHNF